MCVARRSRPISFLGWRSIPDRLLVGGSDGWHVRIWDGRTGRALYSFHGHTSLTEKLAFRADGTQLASASWDVTVRIWDLGRAQALHVLDGDSAVCGQGK